jgi:hypothetical protein
MSKMEGPREFVTFAGIFEEDESGVGIADGEIEVISVLPELLRPTQPPPFAKERVMSHLQEPIVAIFVPAAGANVEEEVTA